MRIKDMIAYMIQDYGGVKILPSKQFGYCPRSDHYMSRHYAPKNARMYTIVGTGNPWYGPHADFFGSYTELANMISEIKCTQNLRK